jgi:hypothetical protein
MSNAHTNPEPTPTLDPKSTTEPTPPPKPFALRPFAAPGRIELPVEVSVTLQSS